MHWSGQERGLHSARGVCPERVYRQWAVESKIRETADVVTFIVRRIDDRLVHEVFGPDLWQADLD